jgi:hypothetical protein
MISQRQLPATFFSPVTGKYMAGMRLIPLPIPAAPAKTTKVAPAGSI